MENHALIPVNFIDDKLIILDQTRLPAEEVYLTMETKEDLYAAIKKLQVRGAPAIGVAAAYGFYTAVRDLDDMGFADFCKAAAKVRDYLASARPTAVNLSWAVNRMYARLTSLSPCGLEEAKTMLRKEAEEICRENGEACRAMGEYGLSLLEPGMGILTHCNAGALATVEYGTCLAPIYLGQEKGYGFKVYADETRPLLQGARLTCWELSRAGVDVTLLCDNMAASVMEQGLIDAVVVGCDRMAANGDGANKIGTFGLAVLAKAFDIPFYMYTPTSTIDLQTPAGGDIPIELRDEKEISHMWYEKPMAPAGVKTYNPSFDVTPAAYITAVITEKGIVRPPYTEGLAKLFV